MCGYRIGWRSYMRGENLNKVHDIVQGLRIYAIVRPLVHPQQTKPDIATLQDKTRSIKQ